MVATQATRTDALVEFLQNEVGDSGLLAQVKKTLKLYDLIAKSGRAYPLKPTKELDKEVIAQAIRQALSGEEVSTILFVSRSQPFEKPEWMNKRVYEITAKDGIRMSLDYSLRGIFNARFWPELREDHNLPWYKLTDALWSILGESLGEASYYLPPNDNGNLWASLKVSLSFYIAFAALDNREMVERLEPLARIQTGCVVLGKQQESDSWLVMVA